MKKLAVFLFTLALLLSLTLFAGAETVSGSFEGHDYSFTVDKTSVKPGDTVKVRCSYSGMWMNAEVVFGNYKNDYSYDDTVVISFNDPKDGFSFTVPDYPENVKINIFTCKSDGEVVDLAIFDLPVTGYKAKPRITIDLTYDSTEVIPGNTFDVAYEVTGGDGGFGSGYYWRCDIVDWSCWLQETVYLGDNPGVISVTLPDNVQNPLLMFNVDDCIGRSHFETFPLSIASEIKEPTEITLSKTKAAIKLDKAQTLKLTAALDQGESKITWKSSNTKVAAVNQSGKVTAKAVGTAKITATTANGLTATCKVTVSAPEIRIENLTSSGKGKAVIKAASDKKMVSWELAYRVKGSSKWKTVTVSSASRSVKKTVKSLKSGKTYQWRVRGLFKASNGKQYYTDWTSVKSLKVK